MSAANCHQTEPGARPGLVISVRSPGCHFPGNKVALRIPQTPGARGGHTPAVARAGLPPAWPSRALCLFFLLVVGPV